MAHILKTILNFVVAGALVGILVVSWVGPKYIAWDNTAGNSGKNNLCYCAQTAREGADRMIGFQLNGSAVGAVAGLGLAVGFLLWRRSRAKKANAAGTSVSSLRS